MANMIADALNNFAVFATQTGTAWDAARTSVTKPDAPIVNQQIATPPKPNTIVIGGLAFDTRVLIGAVIVMLGVLVWRLRK